MTYSNDYLLKVDIKKTYTTITPTFSQGDSGSLIFKIFDDNKEYDLSGFTKAEVIYKLPSGKTLINEASLNKKKEIECRFYSGLEISEPGFTKVLLSIYSGKSVISIQPFNMYVYDNLRNDELSNIKILQDLIIEVQTLIDNNIYVGNFNIATPYKKNNVVLNNGSSWIALQDTVNNPLPILPNTSNPYWRLVAQKGVDGKGSVSKVNNISPDISGNVQLMASDIDSYSKGEVDALLNKITDKINPFESNISEDLAKSAFISEMNKKADYIGMKDTNFVNPHGLGDEQQLTTAKDILLLGLQATGYDGIVKSWSRKKYSFEVKGARERLLNLNTTVTGADLEDFYTIYGGKTGTLNNGVRNLISVVNAPNDNWFIGVILSANNNRFDASRRLFDIASLKLSGKYDIKQANIPLANGDFSDGLDGWSIYSGNPTISKEDYFSPPQSLNADSTGISSQVRKTITLIKDNKYYISAKVKCTRYTKGLLGFQIVTGTTSTMGVKNVTDGYVTVSHIIEPSTNTANLYVGALQSADLDGYVDDITLINLTKEYGTGNEPTKEYMDSFIWKDIPADAGAVSLVPIQNVFAYNQDNIDTLFGKNESTEIPPASLTKVLTAMITLDNIENLNERIELVQSDITSGSGPTFYSGDKLTITDALYCLMLPSSNTIATALSRVVGKKIITNSQ